ncbi:hypothetical protein BCR32DRAFT_268098 [Anaeromyces robustus]|uniref:Uncharacterized protein n=1 Tax=Anaeromyces robustus TaxID=1754192 RepID=A0A1Y1X7J9_9FUNG|nr:hypothetical protein BCR32DRAFT_268098 [Anaeromyces robustus]|eukprot:ORX81722.1 hypothetical protein BCR32DRAFT_268098 [Anaeromyces robustus]
MKYFPSNAIISTSGIVASRCIKLIDNDHVEIREIWWTELREEIRLHARSLNCTHVIGYTETTAIKDELCILSASGTAAILDQSVLENFDSGDVYKYESNLRNGDNNQNNIASDVISYSTYVSQNSKHSSHYSPKKSISYNESIYQKSRYRKKRKSCRLCHISFNKRYGPYATMNYTKCNCCKKKFVPEVLLLTIEPPSDIETIGPGHLIEAQVCRHKKRKDGESNAAQVSDALPFIQYDLHRQLLYKMQIYGVNSIFGLKFNITIGESMLIATAVGTGLFLYALPIPSPLKISRTLPLTERDTKDGKLYELQQKIVQTCEKNLNNIEQLIQEYKSLQHSDVKNIDTSISNQYILEEPIDESKMLDNNNDDNSSSSSSSDTDSDFESDRIQSKITVQIVDDIDEELLSLLLQEENNDDFQMMNIESFPGKTNKFWDLIYDSTQSFSIIKQMFINPGNSLNTQFANILKDIHKEIEFRLSYIQPCLVTGLEYDVQIVESFEVQVHVSGVAISYCRNENERYQFQEEFLDSSDENNDNYDENDLIFPMESIDNDKIKSPISAKDNSNIIESPTGTTKVTLNSLIRASIVHHPFVKSGSNLSDKDSIKRFNYFSTKKKRQSLMKSSLPNSENENEINSSYNSGSFNPINSKSDTINNISNNKLIENVESTSVSRMSNIDNSNNNNNNNTNSIEMIEKIKKDTEDCNKSINTSTSFNKLKYEESKSIKTVSTLNKRSKDTSNNNLIIDTTSKGETYENDSIFKSIKMNTSYYAEITPLSTLQGATIERYLGKLSLHFVKDAHVSESNYNDLGGFTYRLLMEVNSISRAHAIALGGNCILAYRFDKNVIEEGMKKYALVSVSGDIVQVSFNLSKPIPEYFYTFSKSFK